MTAPSASSPTVPTPADGLANARLPQARGAGPEAPKLRSAYLELLKLSLCDLAGTTTTSVGRTEEGVIGSRELRGEGLRIRAAGMDWPLQGVTMVGLGRLDDLQACVESIVSDGVPGDLIEAGTWRGGASILMRATLDSLGASERTVWVADSFQGFPDGESADDQWGGIDYLAVALEEVQANFTRLGYGQGVRFLPGFFEETLPALGDEMFSLVRLDGDTFDATMLGLRCLYPRLSVGGYLVIDDYGALEECRRAVDAFRSEHAITEPLEFVDWTCARWRSQKPLALSDTLGSVPEPASRAHPAGSSRPADVSVPTLRELELEQEIKELQSRLATSEDELTRLRESPAAIAREWLGRARERWRR